MQINFNNIIFSYINGQVRQITIGKIEVIRMVYVAVRDKNWGTIRKQVKNEKINTQGNSFQIQEEHVYKNSEIDFAGTFKITGKPDSSIEFEFIGKAQKDFFKNRIGFCVLHPIENFTNLPYTIIHPDSSVSSFKFPQFISHDHPAKYIKEMKWTMTNGISAHLLFEGDIFEMEDQRNWTDASYKTYCTPLEKPIPEVIHKGDEIYQKITLKIGVSEKLNLNESDEIILGIDQDSEVSFPKIGFSTSGERTNLIPSEQLLLNKLNFNHLRVEIKLFETNWKNKISNNIVVANQIGVLVELAIYIDENSMDTISELIELIQERNIILSSIAVFSKDHISNKKIETDIVSKIRKHFQNIPVGTGTNAYFAELNRNRPNCKNLDFVTFTISPQVHAFDDLSLIENLEAQKHVVESAKRYLQNKPVHIGSVTLRQRFNVVASEEDTESDIDGLPYSIDARQSEMFCALWTLGSIKYLAEAGSSVITFFETIGKRGLFFGEDESIEIENFHAKQGDIYPIYFLFNEIINFKPKKVISSNTTNPLKVISLILDNGSEQAAFLANFSKQSETITTLFEEFNISILGSKGFYKNSIIQIKNNKISIPGESLIKIEHFN